MPGVNTGMGWSLTRASLYTPLSTNMGQGFRYVDLDNDWLLFSIILSLGFQRNT